ncbi:tetratricopeptide repeat protein [Paraburkholderia sp. DHOC27]|nr:tetratricopeptide repeat protein [Paraburkholderia sp. DHOC27]RFU47555.1 tetratricopeptide repeat protein [Paraburkholderia sp. DHOC27]
MISAPGHPAWPAFLTFLQHAAAAKQRGQVEAQCIWLEAAGHLQALDDTVLQQITRALLEQHRHDDVIALSAAIAQLYPDDPITHFRLGYALQMANRHRDALDPYRHALALNPDLPQLRNNLAGALAILRENTSEQVVLLEGAVKAQPSNSDAWINLAQACRFAMNLPRALQAGQRAVELAPDSALALNNYALALKEAQRWEEAEDLTQRAAERAPGDPAMRSNLALVQLVRGDYAHGWPAHEARWQGAMELGGARPAFPAPQWQGEPLAGKTLLVWGEQGMGDLLQGCRFIPLLAERVHAEGGRLVWNSFPQMGALLERSLAQHVDAYSAGGGVESLPQFDYEIPLLSVPLVLGTLGNTLPETVPYLHPDPAAVAAWRSRLAAEHGLNVGLAWTGSLGHQRNPFRRVGWERYAKAFAKLEGVAFYSLQPGAAADVAAARDAGLPMFDYSGELATFDDTAAFVGALDLVITVCTSVAHLSGAIGQRTWVLLDTNPHWTWLLERRDNPWYPSATLYRQREFGEWGPVMDEVTHDLAALASPGK